MSKSIVTHTSVQLADADGASGYLKISGVTPFNTRLDHNASNALWSVVATSAQVQITLSVD